MATLISWTTCGTLLRAIADAAAKVENLVRGIALSFVRAVGLDVPFIFPGLGVARTGNLFG